MTNVKVAIKFRPLLVNENTNDLKWMVSGKQVKSLNGKHNLIVENVFNGQDPTEKTYKKLVEPIVTKALQGFNGTIFAYGQTASGKTFTMIGDNEMEGIIPLAVKDIFRQIKEITTRKFSVRIGYTEIYNDKIYDLFNKRKANLNAFEKEGSIIINQKEFSVNSEEELSKKFATGNRYKKTVGTANNSRSSRSHTIFRITIESDSIDSKEDSLSANLFLVDLAGSEKPDATKLSYNEGLHINKSLLVLGKIIRELSKKKSNLTSGNFRECKLTRILSPALGGNSLTAVICTVSPTVLEETYRTICFAQTAKKAKTHPIVNSTPKLSSALKKIHLDSADCTLSTIKHVHFESDEPKNVSSIDSNESQVISQGLRRSRSESDTDLSTPCKKVKLLPQQETPKSRCTVVTRRRVSFSVNYAFENGSDVIQGNSSLFDACDDGSSRMRVDPLKEKDEKIHFLEDQLEMMRKAFFKHRVQFKSKLACKDAVIETMEKIHIDDMQRSDQRIESLQNDIQLFEKELFAKQTELKQMESKLQMSLEQSNRFDMKFKDCHRQYEGLLLSKNEKLVNIQRRLEEAEAEMKSKRVSDLRTYIELDHHYDLKIKNLRKMFEEKLDEKIQIIKAKDEEIDGLKEIDSRFSSLSHETVIENLNRIMSKSIEELNNFSHHDQSVRPLLFIINKIKKRIVDAKNFFMGAGEPEKEAPHLSPERSQTVIRGSACPHCSRLFSRKTALERHIQGNHISKGRVSRMNSLFE